MEVLMVTSYEEKDLGTIKIAPEALETIAKIAVMEVDGVTDISTSFFGKGKEATQGIKISIEGDDVTVDLSVNIRYGFSLPKIADEIQIRVKDSLEQMTGVNVVAVNVFFSNIEIKK
jgi:uncharacterized alkaline shock family protein YloU